MEIQHAHDNQSETKAWYQVVNGHASTAWAAGEVIELMVSPPAGVVLGAAWQRAAATADSPTPKAVATDAAVGGDFTQMHLAQVLGPYPTLEFTGTAAAELLTMGGVAGHATVFAGTPTAGNQGTWRIGFCISPTSGTPATVSAWLGCL